MAYGRCYLHLIIGVVHSPPFLGDLSKKSLGPTLTGSSHYGLVWWWLCGILFKQWGTLKQDKSRGKKTQDCKDYYQVGLRIRRKGERFQIADSMFPLKHQHQQNIATTGSWGDRRNM